jgi:hypothetical protein
MLLKINTKIQSQCPFPTIYNSRVHRKFIFVKPTFSQLPTDCLSKHDNRFKNTSESIASSWQTESFKSKFQFLWPRKYLHIQLNFHFCLLSFYVNNYQNNLMYKNKNIRKMFVSLNSDIHWCFFITQKVVNKLSSYDEYFDTSIFPSYNKNSIGKSSSKSKGNIHCCQLQCSSGVTSTLPSINTSEFWYSWYWTK